MLLSDTKKGAATVRLSLRRILGGVVGAEVCLSFIWERELV